LDKDRKAILDKKKKKEGTKDKHKQVSKMDWAIAYI
jgi:hypothetical protein